MEINIIQPDEMPTNVWAGGTTTQLYIHPSEASYARRDFDYRLSSATVEVEMSEFTKLPGFSRKLMILDGSLQLIHENHHSVLLNKFDQDAFEGDWNTTSIGFCTDFNLMTGPGYRGTITAKRLDSSQMEAITAEKQCIHLLVYVFSGIITLSKSHQNHRIPKGGLISISKSIMPTCQIKVVKSAQIIVVQIFKE